MGNPAPAKSRKRPGKKYDENRGADRKKGPGRYRAKIEPQKRGPGRNPDSPRKQQRRTKRELIQIELRAEQMREGLRRHGRTGSVSEEKIQRCASRLWTILKERRKRTPLDRMNPELAEKLPPHHRIVTEGALRQTAAAKEIRRRLEVQPLAGPKADRAVAIAIIERNLFSRSPVQIKWHWEDFTQTSFPILEWAYDDPAGRASGLSLSGTYELINGRPGRQRDRQLGLLDRVDPDFLVDLTVEAWLELARCGRWPHMTKALAFDGTKLPQHLLQVQSVSPEHERLLNAGFSDEFCAFGYHGDDGWRGHNGMALTSVVGPPVAVLLKPYRGSVVERSAALELTAELFRRAGGDFVDWEIGVGDRAFFNGEFCDRMLYCYGIKIVCPWVPEWASGEWADNMGNPYCDCGGKRKDMRYVRASYFYTPAERLKLGLRPGEDLRHVVKDVQRWPHIDYRCEVCGTRKTTWPHYIDRGDERIWRAHLYPWFPFKDTHRSNRPGQNRYDMRLDYGGGRGASESFNYTLKRDFLGLTGAAKARCIQSERQMRWYVYGRALAIVLRRLAYVDGTYSSYAARVPEILMKPGLVRLLRELGLL